jgi:predicted  nucleic acid-binding Zn ribbon protein
MGRQRRDDGYTRHKKISRTNHIHTYNDKAAMKGEHETAAQQGREDPGCGKNWVVISRKGHSTNGKLCTQILELNSKLGKIHCQLAIYQIIP